MTLSELAFTCYCYGCRSENDRAYLAFIQATNGEPNVANANHRQAIVEWLNDWGCRQFAIEHHELAKQELLEWYRQFSTRLPLQAIEVWDLREDDYAILRDAFGSLADRTASYRKRGNNQLRVRFGSTGAAKILFTLRPNTYAPWDEPIRDSLRYNGSADSYIEYLQTISGLLGELRPACERHGFELRDLPTRLLRPNSSVPKLIDEYLWMTITQKWHPPTPETFRNWAQWCVME
jgi:hypothetical protein